MKCLLIVLIILELFLFSLLACPVLVDRSAYRKACFAYYQNPTADNLAKFEKECAVNEAIVRNSNLLVFALLVLNGGGIIILWKRKVSKTHV